MTAGVLCVGTLMFGMSKVPQLMVAMHRCSRPIVVRAKTIQTCGCA